MRSVGTLALAAAMSVAAASTQAATASRAARLQTGVAPLTQAQKQDLVRSGEWHDGCPVWFPQLRVVTYRYYGFDHRTHLGQIVVNAKVALPLTTVFAKLLAMRFPIRNGSFDAMYGPHANQNGDVTASFECRDAVPSPCNGNARGTTWSMHAYGEAVDLDPRENPYVGCGMTRDKTAISYLKRSDVRPGMVTPAVVRVFRSIGWGWGGSWFGSTKDYMHFSINGH
ncbi:MAG TPA: M15 family metallopeptidase [Gaiellaceae bacterium]|nr:M15 family metallopeptidase [Gaiellaceae bacterium]